MAPFKMVLRFFASLIVLCGISSNVFAVTVSLASPVTLVGTGNTCPGNTNDTVYAFRLTGTAGGGPAVVTAISFPLTGASTATVPGDVVNYTLHRVVGTTVTTVATTTTNTFSGLTEFILNGTTNSYWITANIAAGATAGHTITVAAFSTLNITSTSAKTGSAALQGTQTIIAPPTSISGPSTVCSGASITLSQGTATAGTWASADPVIASVNTTGVVTGGATTGNVTITYANICASASATVTVNAPNAGTIGGPTGVCVGTPITLTDAVTGGVWSSSNPAVATITPSTGVVTGVTAGTTTISYVATNACGTATVTYTITSSTSVGVGPVNGPADVCAGSTATYIDGIPGGTWSSSNPANATIDNTGLLTAVTPGSTVVSYTITNGCGTAFATKNVTIDNTLDAGTISGTNNVCTGSTVHLSDNVSGGAWSSANTAIATVNGVGVVTGVTAGTATISYLVTNGCGSLAAVYTVTVNPQADAGTISGATLICNGANTILSDNIGGGVWTTSDPSVATVSSAGVVHGTGVGTVTLSYTITNVCSIASAVHTMTVAPAPDAGTISGPSSVCVGSNITLSNTVTGGTWSATGGNATITSSGVVTGVAAGTQVISYTATTACASATSTYTLTVNPLPVVTPVSGPAQVCEGSSIALTDATSGGAWTSDNMAVATVDGSGNVYGVSAGTANISYGVTNICTTIYAPYAVTVNPLPAVSGISGSSDVCLGASVTLSDATPGGVWSSSNTSVATIDPASGVITTVSVGFTGINYSVTNGFGCTTVTSTLESVNALPVVAAISGTSGCLGAVNTLTDATGGGVWSSDNTSVATIDAASGQVTGVATGTATISYTVTNGSGCSTTVTYLETINTVPAQTPITGNNTACAGTVTTLANTTAGGTWTSSAGLNVIVSSTGDVNAVAAGTGYIIYTVTNSCGATADSLFFTVNALPVVSPVTAMYTAICTGNSVTLNDATTGGVYTSSDMSVIMVDALTGVATAEATGAATISYTVTDTNGCAGIATLPVTVGPSFTDVAVYPGTSATLCHGNPVALHIVSGGDVAAVQWVVGNTPIPGATDSEYVANVAGTYYALVSSSSCTEVLPATVITVAPNPIITSPTPGLLTTGTFTTYQWLVNGTVIPGDTTQSINLVANGNYNVVVTDGNSCADTSATFMYTTAGIGSIATTQDVRIYPNPATSVLHIDAPVNVNVTVMSVDGKVMISQKNTTNIDVHSLANGMYLIMVYDENNVCIKTAKFAKAE